jgi:hypothetical protein
MLFEATRRRPRSELIAFCFGDIPNILIERASETPNLQAVGRHEAILGGIRANWETPKEAPADLWGDGGMALGNFASLANFLARSSPPQGELETRLNELLTNMADVGG